MKQNSFILLAQLIFGSSLACSGTPLNQCTANGTAGATNTTDCATGGSGAGGKGAGGSSTGGSGTGGAQAMNISSLSSGSGQSCVLFADGSVSCWGLNSEGQIGDGTTTNRLTPVKIANLTATKIVAGDRNTCAILPDKTLKCWGNNEFGQLGRATTATISPTPLFIPQISEVVDVALGYKHACIVLSSGNMQCWGDNASGQFGDGSHTNSTAPVDVKNISTAQAVSANDFHTCALLKNGDVYCWGESMLTATVHDAKTTPTKVNGVSSATQIASGYHHDHALKGTAVASWGANNYGQLGNGDTDRSNYTDLTSVQISGLSATALSAGMDNTCVIRTDQTVWCWGANSMGELGTGSTDSNAHPTPSQVSGITNAKSIAVGGSSTCALLADSSVKCWGLGMFGELGNGSTETSTVPVGVLF